MASFFQTLLRPDREDDPERTEVARAANLLQIGEFQLLQLAYYGWYGREMQAAVSDRIFRAYMLHSNVPAWARHYARQIIDLAERGALDDGDPGYHRYDCDYYKALPLGARRLAFAVMCIAFVVCGGILVGYFSPPSVTSVLPPYFNEDEIRPVKGEEPPPPGGELRGS
ncbi:MAG: hypothetical protein ACE5GS_08325 [Kiloniellaceae bacterium]